MAIFLRLLRNRRNTSPPLTAISAEEASVFLQGLQRPGQFAVFQLPDPKAFAQALRTSVGGLHLEVSIGHPAVETLMQGVGTVNRNNLGFLTVEMGQDAEAQGGEVLAGALAMLARSAGCENVCRVRTGSQ